VENEIRLTKLMMGMLNISQAECLAVVKVIQRQSFSDNTYQRNIKWFGIQIYKLCDSEDICMT
jgi:hypothetical protein